MDIDTLIGLDRQLLLLMNGSDSLFLDGVVATLTNGLTWIPFYLALFYLVIKNNETMLQIVLAIGGVAVCILLADGLADGIVKPLVARWRPTNDPLLKYTVDVVNDMRGSKYGFFSAHAANTMSIAVFFCLMVRSKLLSWSIVLWSLVMGWTRIYLGLHYPGDVLVGFLWGAMAGVIAYLIYIKLYYKVSPHIKYISTQYTRMGYDFADIDVVQVVMSLTLVYALLKSVVMM
jgi:undecaprenyl-diphosphatase